MEVSGQLRAPAALTPSPGDKVACTHWIGGVGPIVGLEAVEKTKNLPLPGIEPGSSSS
jgi:hypothetical protein